MHPDKRIMNVVSLSDKEMTFYFSENRGNAGERSLPRGVKYLKPI
jgi:hypothetical protein